MATKEKTKSNSVVTLAVDDSGNILTFKVVGSGEATVDLRRVSAPNRARGLLQGIKQRVVNEAALSRDTETGKPVPASEKFAKVQRMAEHLNSGSDDWAPPRDGTSGPSLGVMELAAVAEATGRTVDWARGFVADGSAKHNVTPRAYLAKLCTGVKVAPILTRMRAEAAAGVDPDAELAGLDDEGEEDEREEDDTTEGEGDSTEG